MSDETIGVPNYGDQDRAAPESVVSVIPDDYVAVYDSPDFETGEVVCATLVAAGIAAVMQNPTFGPGSNALPSLGNTWSHAVYVPAAELEAAKRILGAPVLSEEELAAEQAADPTTLEEAEKSVRDA